MNLTVYTLMSSKGGLWLVKKKGAFFDQSETNTANVRTQFKRAELLSSGHIFF